jgi:iron complex outermembrane receptor protein
LNHGYYENYALKNDINVYAKYLQNWVHLKPYVDVQFRHVDYAFEGLNRTGDLVEDTVRYNFINPKLGLAYYPTSRLKFYAMYAVGNREPVRDDFVNSSPDSRPKPEHLRDLEMGFDFETYSVNMAFTFYNMRYKDALVLNGQINDVGAYSRVNVAESYRSGIELALAFQLASKLSIAGNYTRSRNKIIDYIEFVDNWETGEQVELFYEGETSMALSPDNIASADLRCHFNSNLFWSIGYKFIDEQYLDNTENEERKLEAFGTLNSSIVWDRYRIKKVHRLTLGFYFNNITNVNYAPTGYSFTGIINNKRESFNYVYPMAGFNFMFKLRLELQKYTEEIIETN